MNWDALYSTVETAYKAVSNEILEYIAPHNEGLGEGKDACAGEATKPIPSRNSHTTNSTSDTTTDGISSNPSNQIMDKPTDHPNAGDTPQNRPPQNKKPKKKKKKKKSPGGGQQKPGNLEASPPTGLSPPEPEPETSTPTAPAPDVEPAPAPQDHEKKSAKTKKKKKKKKPVTRQMSKSLTHIGSFKDKAAVAGKALKRGFSQKIILRSGSKMSGSPPPTQHVDPASANLGTGEEIEHHLYLWMNLSDHVGYTTDIGFSPNGLFMASSGGPQDHALHLVFRNTLSLGPALVRKTRLSVGDDSISAFTFSSNSMFLVCATEKKREIRVYQLSRRPDAVPKLDGMFPTKHQYSINTVLFNDKLAVPYILTCADDADVNLKFWSRDGKLFKTVATEEVSNRKALVSEDGKMVGLVGHLNSCVELYQVDTGERGRFKKSLVVTDVTSSGHLNTDMEAAVRDCKFHPSNETAIACGDNGSVVVFDMDTNGLKAPTRKVTHRSADETQAFQAVDATSNYSLIVCSRGKDLVFISGLRENGSFGGSEVCTIENAHTSHITKIVVSPEDDCVLTLGAESTHARLWYLPKP